MNTYLKTFTTRFSNASKTICLLFLTALLVCSITNKGICQDSRLIPAGDVGGSNPQIKNINTPAATMLQDQKRAVCILYATDGTGGASGVLVNTVDNNENTIYILTANHVTSGFGLVKDVPDDIYLSFDYELAHAVHRNEADDESEIRRFRRVKVTLRSADAETDLSLLEVNFNDIDLQSPDSPFYNAYAIGWNLHNYVVNHRDYAVIHHPMVDVKKVTADHSSLLEVTNNNGKFYYMEAAYPPTEEGSSGSLLLDKRTKAAVGIISQGETNEDTSFGLFSSLNNLWYDEDNEGLVGLIQFLDPDKTFVGHIPGGYLRDLLPAVETDFNLVVNTSAIFSRNLQTGAFLKPNNRIFNFPPPNQQLDGKFLGKNGLKVQSGDAPIYFFMDAVNNNGMLDLLYAAKYVPGTTNNQTVFVASDLDQGVDADLLVNYHNMNTFSVEIPRTTNFKSYYLDFLVTSAQRRNENLTFDEDAFESILLRHPDEVRVSLGRKDDGIASPSSVRAIKLPYEMPYNARELFDTGWDINELLRSEKYLPSRGSSSDNLFINQVSLQQENNLNRTITTGDNGGYLNLIGKPHHLETVKTSYVDGGYSETNELNVTVDVANTQGQSYYCKVWMDFDLFIDDEQHFHFGAPDAGEGIELIGETTSGLTTAFNFTVAMPDNELLGLAPGESRYVRMRVAISNADNVTEDGIYAQGEVEDYLVKLVAPTMPVLHAWDAEPSGAQEVVIDQSELSGISTIGMTGGVVSDPWHRRLGENAFHLPNTNDYLSLDDNNQFIHDAFTQRTVAFWLYNEDPPGLQDLYDEGGSAHGFGIRLNAGKPELAVRNSGNQVTLSGEQSLPLNEWVHLMGVFAGGNLLLYVNGELVAEASDIGYNQVPYHGDAAAWGGTQGANAFSAVNNNFNGWVDDLRVYDVALQQESLTMLLAEAADITSGLELRHQLDNDYTDASGNNITSSAQSGLQFTDIAAQGSHALFTDAQGKYVDLDTGNAFIHDAFTERTIAFWMQSGATSGKQDIFDEGGSTNGIALRINNGQIELAVQNSNQIAMTSSCVEGFEWIHVAGVFNNGRLQLYVNGELVAENSNVGFTTVGTHNDGAGFGATKGSNAFDQVNNNYWGTLDDLSIYSRALGDSEISSIMALADVTPNPDLCGNPESLSGTGSAKRKEGSRSERLKRSGPMVSLGHGSFNISLQVYPNPSADGRFVVDFELDTPAPVQLTVVSLDGRQLMTRRLNPGSAGQQRVQLEQTQGLPPGMYLLHLNFGNRQESQKLVIGQ